MHFNYFNYCFVPYVMKYVLLTLILIQFNIVNFMQARLLSYKSLVVGNLASKTPIP